MLEFAVAFNGPIAIRYPKGNASSMLEHKQEPIECGKCEWIRKGESAAIISVGTMTETAVKVAERLDKEHIHCSVINARFIKPMDTQMIEDVAKSHSIIIIIEENVLTGGYGSSFLQHVSDMQLDTRVINLGIKDTFIEHGTRKEQLELCRLDENGLYEQIIPYVSGLKQQKNA